MGSGREPVDIVYISADKDVPELIETVVTSFENPAPQVERLERRYVLVQSEAAFRGSRPRLIYRDEDS